MKGEVRDGDGDPRHGSSSAYTYHGCRCATCRDAARDRTRIWRAKIRADAHLGPGRATKDRWHALSSVNAEERSAVCSLCGPTRIRQGGWGLWQCGTSKNGAASQSPRIKRDRELRRVFKISADEYDLKLESQGATCAICGVSACLTGKRLAVDHCHESGQVRGLLCMRCNTGLGSLGDDPERLLHALEYLNHWRAHA